MICRCIFSFLNIDFLFVQLLMSSSFHIYLTMKKKTNTSYLSIFQNC